MSELSFENVLIQVKDALQTNGIKLWEKPYFDLEPVQTEMLVSITFFGQHSFYLHNNDQFLCLKRISQIIWWTR